jgi:uridylate kinase
MLKRVLLKLSGESLQGKQGYGIDTEMLDYYVAEIVKARGKGVEIAVVIGGGNIFRGLQGSGKGFNRIQGDYMGMLATVINSMALQERLESAGCPTLHLGGLEVVPLCAKMSSREAIKALSEKKVVIISGGTGNPFFTTDTAGALRAVEIQADAILKGTRVDGVYSADPEVFPDAVKYDTLSFDEALSQDLKVMDATAFALCRENNMPIVVFNMNVPGNLQRVVEQQPTGTLVKNAG